MSFAWPLFLWLLLLLPLTLAAARLAARRRRRTAGALADEHLWGRIARRPARSRVAWTRALQIAALACLLLAAGRPVASPPLPVNTATVIVALDASRSMLADDVTPNRLEVARDLAEAFVRGAPASTRIGLVSFSDGAAQLIPPTTDREMLLEALASVEPARNTSLTAAVLSGVRALPGREEAEVPPALAAPGTRSLDEDGTDAAPQEQEAFPPGRMILLSDGGDNVSVNPELPPALALDVAARFARDHEVAIYTVPVGQDGGAVSQIDGQLYFVPFEPEPLERLAELSGGRRVDASDEREIAAVFRELGRDIRWQATPTEISVVFAGGAVILLLVAGGLSLSWQRRVP